MSDVRYAAGLLVRGMKNPDDPTNTSPTLFTSSEFASIDAPTGNLTSAQFVGRIPRTKDALDGYTSQVNLREPFSAGGNLKIKLQDKAPRVGTSGRDLGPQLAADTPSASSQSWNVVSPLAYLAKGIGAPPMTSLRLRGPKPGTGDILFIADEAVLVVSVVTVADFLHDVDLERGVLGTRNQEHTVNPSRIPPGDDGSAVSLTFTDRPDFDSYSFEAELHHFSMVGGVATKIDSYYRLTEGRPVPDHDQWTVTTKDFAKVLMDHQAKRNAIELSHSIQVIEEISSGQGNGYVSTVDKIRPPHVRMFLTPEQAERLFNRRLRAFESSGVLTAEITALAARYFYSTKFRTEVVVAAGGWNWVYKVDDITHQNSPFWAPDLDIDYVVLALSLVTADRDASVRNDPQEYPFKPADNEELSAQVGVLIDSESTITLLGRGAVYNQGFTIWEADPVRVSEGETPPRVSLRCWLMDMTPIERLLTLFISRHGGGQAHLDYDIIPGEVCPGIDPSFFNLTAGTADPLLIDTATLKLLEVDALLTTKENVPLDLAQGFVMGKEINRTCRLYGLIRADVPDGLTLRLLERGISTAPTDVNQVVGKGFLIQQGTRLPAEKALIIEGGFDGVTLEPRWRQPIYVLNASAKDLEGATKLRLWQQGSSQSVEQIFSGPMGKAAQLALLSAKGSPATYKVTTHRPAGARYAGDLVLWTDNSIPTPAGRGVTNLRMKVIGRDVEFWTGDQNLLLLPDNLNTLTASEGCLAPALRIVSSAFTLGQASCFVELLGDEGGTFDITTSLGIYQTLVANNHNIRVVNEGGQNPGAERPGWIECDGSVDSIGYDAAGRNLIVFDIDAAWERAGYTRSELVAPGTSYILLADYQANTLTGDDRYPNADQGPQGDDFAWIGAGDGLPPNNKPYFQNLSKIQDL